jgi:hypothetical protein
MAKAPWTLTEEIFLLACVEHCFQNGLKFEENISRAFQYKGYERTWKGISRRLVDLSRDKPNAVACFRDKGAGAAKLWDLHSGIIREQLSIAERAMSTLGVESAPLAHGVMDTEQGNKTSTQLVAHTEATEVRKMKK